MIYTRTGKGDEEVSARRPGLDAKLNSVLFLVDGKRTRDDINALAEHLGSPADSIDRLVEGGYVQTTEKLPAPPAVAGSAATAKGSAPSAVQATHSLADSALQGALYQHLIKAAKQHLGMWGLRFHVRIEKANNLPELRALIKPMGEAIAKSKGLATANSFMEETEALISANN